MTVWVDGGVFENDSQVGIWRLFFEVMRRTAGRVDYRLWLRSRPAQPLPPGVAVVYDAGRLPGRRWDVVRRGRRALARRRPPPGLARADLFHSTYFTRPPVPVPELAGVYDLIAERLFDICPGWAPESVKEKAAVLAVARRCAAISAATAADVGRFYPRLAGRTDVVPLAADHLPPAAPPGPRQPAALFVGHRGQYKNFRTLLDAMTRPGWPTGVGLWVAGPPFEPHERRLLEVLGLADRVVHHGRVTDARLGELYSLAGCFVFPSLLEGFGLPLLEAQGRGCPVACSDIPVFREVAGDGAVFFDPRLGERLADAVAAAVRPPAARRLAEAGAVNAGRFTWDRSAEEMLAVYRRAAADGPAA